MTALRHLPCSVCRCFPQTKHTEHCVSLDSMDMKFGTAVQMQANLDCSGVCYNTLQLVLQTIADNDVHHVKSVCKSSQSLW